MAKLILSVDGQVLKEYTLSKERTLIGRKPHNDIQIDNLAVSGEHAAIITILNDSFIEDLGSTNGTMVNGKPVKKHFLQNNDVVEIGKHKLKYFNDAPTAATAADFEKTMIIRNPAKAAPAPSPRRRSGTQTNLKAMTPEAPKPAAVPAPAPARPRRLPADRAAAERDHATTPARRPHRRPRARPRPLREAAIQVLSGAAAGRTLDLTKNLTTIGKPGLQVAVITKRPNGYFITHVEGATYPDPQRRFAGRPGPCAGRPRPHRDRGREDGVLLQAVSVSRPRSPPGGRRPARPEPVECRTPTDDAPRHNGPNPVSMPAGIAASARKAEPRGPRPRSDDEDQGTGVQRRHRREPAHDLVPGRRGRTDRRGHGRRRPHAREPGEDRPHLREPLAPRSRDQHPVPGRHGVLDAREARSWSTASRRPSTSSARTSSTGRSGPTSPRFPTPTTRSWCTGRSAWARRWSSRGRRFTAIPANHTVPAVGYLARQRTATPHLQRRHVGERRACGRWSTHGRNLKIPDHRDRVLEQGARHRHRVQAPLPGHARRGAGEDDACSPRCSSPTSSRGRALSP